jgi:hypothetical protein
MNTAAQVASVVVALAVIASAAPVVERSLYEQQSDFYEELVQALPFDEVQTKHEGVYDNNNGTVAARATYQAAQVKKPFIVSAARDKAENETRVAQEAEVAEKLKAYHTKQNATAEAAEAAQTAADDTAKSTVTETTEAVHKILHPDAPDKEAKNNEFLKQVAAAAEAKGTAMSQGSMYEPGKPGDVPPSLPTAAMFEENAKVPTHEEIALQDMFVEEEAAYKQQRILYESALP